MCIFSGPFPIYLQTLQNSFTFIITMNCGVGATALVPDWLQATALTFGTSVAVFVLIVGSYLFIWALGPIVHLLGIKLTRKDALGGMFSIIFWPPVAAISSGGASLIYGVQHSETGFVLGGTGALAVGLLVLLVLLGNMPHFRYPIFGVVIGLILVLYGFQVPALQGGLWIAGFIILAIACMVLGVILGRRTTLA